MAESADDLFRQLAEQAKKAVPAQKPQDAPDAIFSQLAGQAKALPARAATAMPAAVAQARSTLMPEVEQSALPDALKNALQGFLSVGVGPQVAKQAIEKPAETAMQIGGMALSGGITTGVTAMGTTLARQLLRQMPTFAKWLPAVSEVIGSYIGRQANVAVGFEEAGALGDVLSVAIPGASRTLAARRAAGGPVIAAATKRLPDEQVAALGSGTAAVSPLDLLGERQQGAVMRRVRATPASRATRMRELAAESGGRVMEALKQAEGEFKQLSDALYDSVRSAVSAAYPQNSIASMIDVTDMGMSQKVLQTLGVNSSTRSVLTTGRGGKLVAQPRTMVTFDDALRLRSQLGRKASTKHLTDRIGAAGLETMQSQLDVKIDRIANNAGVLGELRNARETFKTEVAPRFRTKYFNALRAKSAEELIEKAPTLTADEAKNLLNSLVTLTTQNAPGALRSIQTPGGIIRVAPSAARDELRTGVVAHLLSKSVDPTTGTIKAARLQAQITNMRPEVREALLGKETGDAIEKFATELASAQSRLSLGIGVAGGAAIGVGNAMEAGGNVARGLFSAAETANELSMMGRMLVGRPKVVNRLIGRILQQDRSAARDFTRETGLRIMGSQAVRDYMSVSPDAEKAGQ